MLNYINLLHNFNGLYRPTIRVWLVPQSYPIQPNLFLVWPFNQRNMHVQFQWNWCIYAYSTTHVKFYTTLYTIFHRILSYCQILHWVNAFFVDSLNSHGSSQLKWDTGLWQLFGSTSILIAWNFEIFNYFQYRSIRNLKYIYKKGDVLFHSNGKHEEKCHSYNKSIILLWKLSYRF